MSNAASQATDFYEKAAKHGKVYTITDADSFLVFLINGKEVVPFWTSRSRIEKVKVNHPKYVKYVIDEIRLEKFLEKTLEQFEEEKIHIGLNWSGARLIGYDVSVADLKKNLGYWLNKEIGKDST